MKDVSNGQRAFWMVLITSLAAPFLAGLIEVALSSWPSSPITCCRRGGRTRSVRCNRCVCLGRASGDGRGARV